MFIEVMLVFCVLFVEVFEYLLFGVLLYWMQDWLILFLFYVKEVCGVMFIDVDGYCYVDFCFGDIGVMFGYVFEFVVCVFVEQVMCGYMMMLLSEDVVWVLCEFVWCFKLLVW